VRHDYGPQFPAARGISRIFGFKKPRNLFPAEFPAEFVFFRGIRLFAAEFVFLPRDLTFFIQTTIFSQKMTSK